MCFNKQHSLCFTELENITLLDDNTDKNASREFMQKIACPDQINMKHISHSRQIVLRLIRPGSRNGHAAANEFID